MHGEHPSRPLFILHVAGGWLAVCLLAQVALHSDESGLCDVRYAVKRDSI